MAVMSDQTEASGDANQAGNAHATESQGEHGDQRLSVIFEIAKTLVKQQDLETLLSELLSVVIESLEAADAGVLLLLDPSDQRLAIRAALGYDLPNLSRIRLAPGEAICGKSFQTGRVGVYRTPESIAGARKDLSLANSALFKASMRGLSDAQSAICLPLVCGETDVGTLMFENRRRHDGFGPMELPFLKALADLIALFVDNARLREQLHATRALEEGNRLKAELVSILAHEMRTPLTSIKGYSTALLMEDTSFPPETQREFLQIVDEECDTLQELIHDLLESSIIDAGLLRLEPQPVRLPFLTKRVTDDIGHRTQSHRFLMDFAEPFPIVDADPNRVEQVLRNLLDNAVKYSPQGGLVVVRGEAQEGEVIISVADQGVGIAPEHLNRLFEKFFRVASALGRHVVGSGLGLPIARTIVETHGGRIWAESQLGQGSTFYFTLPLDGLSYGHSGQQGGSD